MYIRYVAGVFLNKVLQVFYFYFAYLFCQLRVSSFLDSLYGTQFCTVIVKIAKFVFFTGVLPSPLFAFTGYLHYLYCLYYQQAVIIVFFSSNK